MQKIRMLSNGPNGNHFAGKEVEVDNARAALLLDGKHAVHTDALQEIVNHEEETTTPFTDYLIQEVSEIDI